MLSRVECIVVDEVDRLVDVLPRHAPPREAEKRKKHTRPIAALLERVLQSKPGVQVGIRHPTPSVNYVCTMRRILRAWFYNIGGVISASSGSEFFDRERILWRGIDIMCSVS